MENNANMEELDKAGDWYLYEIAADLDTVPNLEATVDDMLSADYKRRFYAEYHQLKLRCERLGQLLDDYDMEKLDFELSCPIDLLVEQRKYMAVYLRVLERRASIENIDLSIEEVTDGE